MFKVRPVRLVGRKSFIVSAASAAVDHYGMYQATNVFVADDGKFFVVYWGIIYDTDPTGETTAVVPPQRPEQTLWCNIISMSLWARLHTESSVFQRRNELTYPPTEELQSRALLFNILHEYRRKAVLPGAKVDEDRMTLEESFVLVEARVQRTAFAGQETLYLDVQVTDQRSEDVPDASVPDTSEMEIDSLPLGQMTVSQDA